MSAVSKLSVPLKNIDELLGLALRHHTGGKVRDLLGVHATVDDTTNNTNDAGFTSIGGEDNGTIGTRARSPSPNSPFASLPLLEQLESLRQECRDAIADLHDVEAAGEMQLNDLSAEVYAQREATQRAAIEEDKMNDYVAQGLLYVQGTPLVETDAAVYNSAAVFFEGTSFNDSMLDNLGLFLTKLPATASPLESKGELYRPTTQDCEEIQELRWLPSEVALADANAVNTITDEFSTRVATRIQIGLNADTIMHKHVSTDDKEQAVKEQGGYCKACLAPLKKSFNPLRGWDCAVFCFYSGYYYCENCHHRNTVSPLPALIAKEWNFTPKPICDAARDFLEIHADSPIICISAINPQLYTRVPILDAARRLRVEINALHAIGVHCKEYRHAFFECGSGRGGGARRRLSTLNGGGSSSSGSSSQTSVNNLAGGDRFVMMDSSRGLSGGGGISRGGPRAGEYETYVPLGQRYLAMDSEFWSLNDLITLHKADPSNSFKLPSGWADGDASGSGGGGSNSFTRARSKSIVQPYPGNSHPLDIMAPLCPLIRQLLEMRKQFLRHVVKECVDRCLPRAVHVCPACQRSGGSDLVFSFDQHNHNRCKGCYSSYHSKCWSALGILQGSQGAPTCPICFTVAVNKRKGLAAAKGAVAKK